MFRFNGRKPIATYSLNLDIKALDSARKIGVVERGSTWMVGFWWGDICGGRWPSQATRVASYMMLKDKSVWTLGLGECFGHLFN